MFFSAHMARARLRDRHQDNLRKKLQVLKAEQGVTANSSGSDSETGTSSRVATQRVEIKAEPVEEVTVDQDSAIPGPSREADNPKENESGNEETNAGDEAANEMLTECFQDYERGGYSPVFLTPNQLEPGTIVVTEEDDLKRLDFARLQVLGTGSKIEVIKIILREIS